MIAVDYDARRRAAAAYHRYDTQLRAARRALAGHEMRIALWTERNEPGKAEYYSKRAATEAAKVERFERLAAKWKAAVLGE